MDNRLAVVAVFFDVAKGGNSPNEFIDGLNLQSLTGNVTNTTASKIPMSKLLRNLNLNKLFTYKGSKTTPPCTELVTWLVINHP